MSEFIPRGNPVGAQGPEVSGPPQVGKEPPPRGRRRSASALVVIVVLLLLGTLSPGLFRGQPRGSDAAAQAAVRRAVSTAVECYMRSGSFDGCDTAALSDQAATHAVDMTFTEGNSSEPKVVSVKAASDGRTIEVAALAPETGVCFAARWGGDVSTGFGWQNGPACTAGIDATNYADYWWSPAAP